MSTFLFGVPGKVVEVPMPLTGMDFSSNRDTTFDELASGGRSATPAPTGYKTLSMNWTTYDTRLRPLLDAYGGAWGTSAFWLVDPSAHEDNILPQRWSNAHQLAYLAGGWCKPQVSVGTTPIDRKVKFTQVTTATAQTKVEGVVRFRAIRVPGKAYYLTTRGSRTGTAGVRVRGYNPATNLWETLGTYDPNGTTYSPTVVMASSTTHTFIELDLYLPAGSTLTLSKLALGTEAWAGTEPPPGDGIGAVQFDGQLQGQIFRKGIGWIGMACDFTEIEAGEGVMRLG